MQFLESYHRGDFSGAWDLLETAIQKDPDCANSLACEEMMTGTFITVRHGVERIINALRDTGYEFWCEQEHSGAPLMASSAKVLATIEQAKVDLGPVPLAIVWFVRIVGNVDLRQTPDHTSAVYSWVRLPGKNDRNQNPHRKEVVASMPRLGDFDPLCFMLYDFMSPRYEEEREFEKRRTGGKILIEFAPDVYHKADISGGTSYSVLAPDVSADPNIELAGCSFMTYLRTCIANGGFWGAREPVRTNTNFATGIYKASNGLFLPTHPVLRELQTAFVPF